MMEKLGAPQTHLGLKSMIKVMDLNHSVEITKKILSRNFSLQKFREIDCFQCKSRKSFFELISRTFFQVRVNFVFFHTV